MGLSVFLIGRDSELYEDVKNVFDDILEAIHYQNHDVSNFTLGVLGTEYYGEDIGSYENLHLLRAYAANLETDNYALDEPLEEGKVSHLLKNIYDGSTPIRNFRHLINHSDFDGYYFPIDFPEPVQLTHGNMAYGTDGPIGSCFRLFSELEQINKYLKVPGDCGQLGSENLWNILNKDLWNAEKWSWGVLHWLARESISKNLILTFA